ncbi:hypothetical protein GRF61_17345 [Azoarcus sp. TTM-91]|uniref:hypothetical protein n=1 Tax=Azoarcus sp. TTM-91 TaxID=2691581 RepID=UPI00145D2C92|nr:hypothetical protein [Azoarcus sp. TTM-91]NMG36215.1 hypothetical protein [Azoarcus sp. TTM-91]
MDLLAHTGVPLEDQMLTWREMAGMPISKLDDDAFTRVRVILMNAMELDAMRLQEFGARSEMDLRLSLACVRRIEQHQATAVSWMLSADHSALEASVACEQVAVELTAAIAQHEPDPYLAQVYRFGLLENLDRLYRYAALLDRLEGKDANNILQGYTDIVPGRPTAESHRAPRDDLRRPSGPGAPLASRLHMILVAAAAHRARDYYMTIGPAFADPVARELYAEIASCGEQHATQYGALLAPGPSFLESWLLHEAAEVYAYLSCAQSESNPRIRAVWERFCDYELGQLQHVGELMRRHEHRDPAEVLSHGLPAPLEFRSQRDFVRDVLSEEVHLRARDGGFVERDGESAESLEYRRRVNAHGSPSTQVALSYHWTAGTELNRPRPPS